MGRQRLPVDHPDHHHPVLLLRRRLGRQLLRLWLRLQQRLRVQQRLWLWVQRRLRLQQRLRVQRRLRLLLSQTPRLPYLISCLERAAGPEGPALRGQRSDRLNRVKSLSAAGLPRISLYTLRRIRLSVTTSSTGRS